LELREYLTTLAEQLSSELRPILSISEVTNNSDLLGKYTEAALRNLVHRVVQPMRICTGAIVDYPLPLQLKQRDIIIWAPCPIPAIFETQGFGLVPRSSAFGVIEVKKSNYSAAVDEQLEEFSASVNSAVAEPRGAMADFGKNYGIGVVCMLTATPSSRLQKLIDDKRAVAMFDVTGGPPAVRTKDVLTLANFLFFIAWRYHMQMGLPNYPQVVTGDT
jgi:hypothetical protein